MTLKYMMMLQKLIRFATKLINLGVSDKLSSLNAIRYKFVNAFNLMLIGFSLIVSATDIYDGNTTRIYISLISGAFYMLSTYYSYKGRTEISILITSATVNIFCFALCYTQFVEPIEIIPQLFFCISFTLFLLPGKKTRLIYIGLCCLFLTLIALNYNFNMDKSLMTLFQVILCMYLQSLFMLFVESQDRKLNDHVSELERSNLNEVKLNRMLKTKNEEVIAYSNIMTHDLKAPLRNILAFIGLIKRKEDIVNKDSLEFFSIIENSATSMNSLINNLLEYSKVGSHSIKIEKVDIGDVVNEVILSNFKYEMDNGNLKFECAKLPVINGDKQLLKILFQNFISNSIKYQPKNKEGHIPALSILSKPDIQYDNILIIDNGIGIRAEYIDELFTPFRRFHSSSAYEGTGLGMSICKRIIEQLNGEIKLLKTSENGTTFQLSFNKSLKRIV